MESWWHDDADKSTILNQCYSNVFTYDNNIIPDFPPKVVEAALADIDFNSSMVFRHLSRLRAKTSCGPDGLNAVFLKNLAPSLSFPLSISFQRVI